jgi:hypothetical protein
MGPVGVDKTFLATALGHAAIRRRRSVHFERCDRLLKRLRASRLDNSHEAEIRKLLRVDLLIIDDFALQPVDSVDTADIYELIVERHRTASTVITSNREPVEWLGLMADPLLAQSAIDRLQSAAHELVLDGESYRQRQKPTINPTLDEGRAPRRSSPRRDLTEPHKWSHATGERVVPSSWRATAAQRVSATQRGRRDPPNLAQSPTTTPPGRSSVDGRQPRRGLAKARPLLNRHFVWLTLSGQVRTRILDHGEGDPSCSSTADPTRQLPEGSPAVAGDATSMAH